MAPWPEQGNEPKAPDKSCSKGVESNSSDSPKTDSGIIEDPEARSAAGKTDDKQDEKNSGVSELDDGQLKALLDEAITYKCPKDREGKSILFRELLEEVEAESDGGEESNPPPFGVVDQCRSGKRRRRDAVVSERQTRGGSLQNIVQACADFESAYLGNRGKKSLGGSGRRKDLGHYGVGPSLSGGGSCGRGGGGSGGGSGGSVSARQREGGSLPCNVNVGSGVGGCSGGLQSLHNPASECPFEAVVCRRRSEQRVSWDLDNNEDVMPAHMDRGGGGGPVAAPPPADIATGRSEAGVDLVGVTEGGVGGPPLSECETRVTVVVEGVANGVLESTAPDQVVHQCVTVERVVDVPSAELRAQCCASLLSTAIEDRTGDGVELQLLHVSEDRSGRSKFKDEVCHTDPSPCAPEVLEFASEQLPISSPVPAVPLSLAVASSSAGDRKTQREIARGDSVDTVVPFPLHMEEKKPLMSASSSAMTLELSKGLVNGMETAPLQLPSSYASVKSLVGSASQVSSISESLGTSATLSSSHPGCVDNQTVQSGVLEERGGLSVAAKDAAIRKQSGETGPKAIMPIQGTYSFLPSPHSLSGLTYSPKHWIPDHISRLNFHGGKDLNDIKSLDENGNAVTMSQGLNKDMHEKSKGKPRRLRTQQEGYLSESVEGYCGDQDLDCLLKFIGMDVEKKSKNSYSGPVERVRRSNIRRESDRGVGSDFTSGRVKAARDKNGVTEEDLTTCGLSSDKASSGSKMGPRAAGGGRQSQIQRDNKMKKSNSLEEISRTKNEDLTLTASSSMPKHSKEMLQQAALGVDGKEGGFERDVRDEDVCNHNEKVLQDDSNGNIETGQKSVVPSAPKVSLAATSFKEDFYAVTDASPQVLEETEFHVVTKKQRRKKRRGGAGDGGGTMDGCGGHNNQDNYSYGLGGRADCSDEFKQGGERGDGGSHFDGNGDDESMWGGSGTADGRFCSYRRHHRRHRSQRSNDRLKSTSSVPPSEHSGESSDDSDSVHSLPVSPLVPRPPADPCSTSSGSTPQASYADIARMAFGTMLVVASNPGSAPNGNPVPPAPTQKSKTVVTAATSGQTSNFPPMTSASHSSTTSLPHFGSARMNIGTPPVSGYKSATTAAPPPVPAGEIPSPVVSSALPDPRPVPQALPSEEHKVASEVEVSIQNSVSASLPVVEPRKKDAMTCTTLDCKVVASSYAVSSVISSQPKVEVESVAHSVTPSTPNILEDYYPSLQESIHEKNERRNGKLGQQLTSTNKVSSLEDKRGSKVAAPSPSAPFTRENKASEVEIPVSNVGLVSDKTVVLPVAEKQPVPLAMKTKEPSVTATRIKGSGRKPGFRSLPPVVIMDHHYRQDGASKEGSAMGDASDVGTSSRNCTSSDIGGFTFGFEVNEELLALSGPDGIASCDQSSRHVPENEDKDPNSSPSVAGEEESQSQPLRPVITPVAQCLPTGKEVMPVFRSPGDVDTKKFNYEKIVSFIGSSWEDVLKEMTVPAVKPTGNRVQYYDGAQ